MSFPHPTARVWPVLCAVLLAGWLSVTGCSADVPPAVVPQPDARPSVVLISLDGTRPADLTEQQLPSLLEVARAGARTERLVPVDPSNTFPNHASLATGVRPDVHGIVNNDFLDPQRGRFEKRDAHLWLEAEPIWSIAERAGLPSASFYWVGSEGPWRGGPAPRETRRFSSRTSEKEKVDQILAWLDERDPERRPRLITCWFHGADSAGHDDGPGAPSVARALAPQDRQIARLVRELEARRLFESTTLIFVSDHGMARVGERVNLGRRLRKAGIGGRVIGVGGFASIHLDASERSEGRIQRAVAIAREAGLEAFARQRAPADWRVASPRFGDVVVRAPLDKAIVTGFTRARGLHGYDARLPEMAGILVARGRGIRPGTRLGAVSSLAVAPTVLALLGLPIPEEMAEPPIQSWLSGLDEPSSHSP